ncbi:MAG TPA: hypothetical protein VM099_15895 [Gemmatimonadaceae bacterium]|nr:hypothetical protein [Gemmatimonadaceae bacterium]
MTTATRPRKSAPSSEYPGAAKCRKKFLKFFPDAFADETYIDWERDYKWEAHERWESTLGQPEFRGLLKSGEYQEAARRAVNLESRTNLLFSFEKMALRDAVKSEAGARAFAEGLYDWVYSAGDDRKKFEQWCEVVAALPRRQTRVLTWPLVTVFGFLALPEKHFFLKPMVTKLAAREYGFDFQYRSRPNWETYENLLEFAEVVRRDLSDLDPRDMIDIQSFLWVQGSDEYD